MGRPQRRPGLTPWRLGIEKTFDNPRCARGDEHGMLSKTKKMVLALRPEGRLFSLWPIQLVSAGRRRYGAAAPHEIIAS